MTQHSSESCPAVWNVFHDATVIAVSGSVPGTLRLTLDCDYLRDRIDHPGDRFYLTLSECTCFAYRPWDDDTLVIQDFQLIEERRLWILSAEVMAEFCKVHCSEHIPDGNGGVLEIAASGASVTLDGDRSITQSELESVAREYWAEFASNSSALQSRGDK